MTENNVQYYNGKFATPYEVDIELKDDSVIITDANDNNGHPVSVPLSGCHYVTSGNNAFIYLNKQSTSYLVIPSSNEYYNDIISALKKKQTGLYNRLLSQKWYTLLFIIAVLLGLMYLVVDKVIPAIALKVISVNQEISIGEGFYHSFTADAEVDSTGTFILQAFADDLQLSKKYPIKVTLVKDTIVNAFALPGGHLVVYSGIINKIERPEELVALLSHESSHVNNRHSLKTIISRLSTTAAISLFTSDINGLSRGLIQNAQMLHSLSYSRGLEKQADDEGMKLMIENKINPVGMKWLMEDLQKSAKNVPSQLSFLSTHPLTPQRINDAANFSKRYPQMNTSVNEQLQSLWSELKLQVKKD